MSMEGAASFWDDRAVYFKQDNNGLEGYIQKYIQYWEDAFKNRGLNDARLGSHLVSCGQTAIIIAVSTMRGEVLPLELGDGKIQPEDALSMWLNAPSNYKFLTTSENPNPQDVRQPLNEVMSYHHKAINYLWGEEVRAKLDWHVSIEEMAYHVRTKGSAIVLMKNPGHYNVVTAADNDAEKFSIIDPWAGRVPGWNGNSFNVTESYENFEKKWYRYATLLSYPDRDTPFHP